MAAKWWRYNSTDHIFEQSLDEGITWTQPPLHARIITEGVFDPARLGGNLAYVDRSNNFIASEHWFQGNGGFVRLNLVDNAQTAGAKTFSFLNYSNILYIVPATDDGAGWTAGATDWECGITLYRHGAVKIRGSLQSGGPIYPGDTVSSGVQATWYIAGNATYGLATNTGFRAESGLWSGGNVTAAAAVYDFGRSYYMGMWQAYSVGAGNFWGDAGGITFSGADYVYSIVGNTCIINVLAYLGLSVNNTYLYFHTPVVALRQMSGMGMVQGPESSVPIIGLSSTGQYVQISKASGHPYGSYYFPAGSYVLYFQMAIQF